MIKAIEDIKKYPDRCASLLRRWNRGLGRKQFHLKFAALLLIACVVPCLFIIPVFCNPVEISLSAETDFCPLLSFAVTSNILILAESIISFAVFEECMLLAHGPEFLSVPIVFFAKDRPPEF